MACQRCASDQRNKFDAEINIHLPLRNGLGKPAILIFPKVEVCLRCGLAEFTVPENQLGMLAKGGLHDDIAVV